MVSGTVKTILEAVLGKASNHRRHKKATRWRKGDGFMLVSCFGNQINIDTALVQKYEDSVAPFDSRRAEYMALTGGVDKDSPLESIADAISEGLLSETDVYNQRNNIVIQAHRKGII